MIYKFTSNLRRGRTETFDLFGAPEGISPLSFDMLFKNPEDVKKFCQNLFTDQLRKEGFTSWTLQINFVKTPTT